MELTEIKWLHVEASTRCNAWCPSCPRNLDGYGLLPGLEERDLSFNTFYNAVNKLPNLETIQFCGNYGDPLVARYFLNMIEYIKGKVPVIRIHTNGSLRSHSWWHKLGGSLRNTKHEVIFAIDGTEETHSIYRQGTNYNKIIKNATAFIKAGGNATWQFIPFKHNEQEILFVMSESQRLGFKRFTVQKNVRLSKSLARNWRTGKEYEIKFWKNDDLVNMNKEEGKVIQPENCMHLELKSLYLNAKGHLYPCCFLDNIVQYTGITDLSQEVFDDPHSVCLDECGTKNLLSSKRR